MRYKYYASATTTTSPTSPNLTAELSPEIFSVSGARMPLERSSRRSDRRDAFPSFPFVNAALRSPLTPIKSHQLSTFLPDAAHTHPIDDPLYSPPFYGLSFGNTGNGAIAREGALVSEALLTSIPSTPPTPPSSSIKERMIACFEGQFHPFLDMRISLQ